MALKMSKQPARVTVNLTEEQRDALQRLAQRCCSSASQMGQLAIIALLDQTEREDVLPLLTKYPIGDFIKGA